MVVLPLISVSAMYSTLLVVVLILAAALAIVVAVLARTSYNPHPSEADAELA